MPLIEHIISIIAPHLCLSCGTEGSLLCQACAAKVPIAAECCYACLRPSLGGITCPVCATSSPLSSVCAVTSYTGLAKQLVWQLKFNRARDAARTIAIMCDTRLRLPADTTIMYVPTANSRVRLRGYDQAERIARHIARGHDYPLSAALARTSSVRQVGSDAAQRRTQLASAFRVTPPREVQNKRILLIDDVITTGSSLEACARVLLAAGAIDVRALVFARA